MTSCLGSFLFAGCILQWGILVSALPKQINYNQSQLLVLSDRILQLGSASHTWTKAVGSLVSRRKTGFCCAFVLHSDFQRQNLTVSVQEVCPFSTTIFSRSFSDLCSVTCTYFLLSRHSSFSRPLQVLKFCWEGKQRTRQQWRQGKLKCVPRTVVLRDQWMQSIGCVDQLWRISDVSHRALVSVSQLGR